MEIVVSEDVPPSTRSVSPTGICHRIITIYYSYIAIFLALSYNVHFADVGVQLVSLPTIAPITMAPPAAANIEVTATSSSTDPGTELSTKVPPASEISLMFSFETTGSTTRNIFEESPLSESAPITIIIVIPGGPTPRIPTLASSLLQLLAPHVSAVVSNQTPPTIATHLPVVPHSASASSLLPAPVQALPNDDPLRKKFQHSVCTSYTYCIDVSMFFEGHHSIELGCPMLLNYLNNIGNIGDSEQAAPYQACLATLDEQVQELDTL